MICEELSSLLEIINGEFGTFLDKINAIQVLFTFEDAASFGATTRTVGNLSYGGQSYLRTETPGTFVPDRPDRIQGELTAFSTKTWAFQSAVPGSFTVDRWVQDQRPVPQEITAALAVEGTETSHDAAVADSRFNIINFQEHAIAATNWLLNMPTSDDGTPRFNLDGLTDIKIRFQHFTVSRR